MLCEHFLLHLVYVYDYILLRATNSDPQATGEGWRKGFQPARGNTVKYDAPKGPVKKGLHP